MNKRYKILIADDSISIRDSLKEMLAEVSENKYLVLTAVNGLEACNIAFREQPDLILTDIEMPVMNGIKAIKKIRATSLIQNIPIIVMSSTKQFHEAIDAGADDFLLKPFSPYEALLRIQQILKLAEKENKVQQQHKLLKIQKQEVVNQRDTILRQKTELLEDLRYARFVQKAILPSSQLLTDIFKDFFIFDQPKNIVSGDFYWVARKDQKVILAVGDCTGHGMSGALMTMAGTTFLNEIISETTTLSSDQILNDLRLRVIQLLNQKGVIGEVSNGMDIALFVYDEANGLMQFSGANNPLYIIREHHPLEVIKGDRMPIGFYFDFDQPFTRKEFKVSKGDSIFLFSDGYPDQFGGADGKKFRYAKFQELLTQTASLLSFGIQHELVKETMDHWIEGYEQVDDMLIMGIRL